ncbi:MAG: DoxX family protein [Pseudonocardiales bacterium]|nr:MAG: DoxX family protein [Pseudonocardiales bacterium]
MADATTTTPATHPADVGLLLLRVVFGGFLAVSGTQKLFGWFQGAGLAAMSHGLESMGYHPGTFFAMVTGLTELGGGLLLLLGLFTPLAAAAVLGVMIHATETLWSIGFFGNGSEPGAESPITFAVVGAVVAFTGAGKFSLDHGRPWRREGWAWALGSIAFAVVTALATFALKAILH